VVYEHFRPLPPSLEPIFVEALPSSFYEKEVPTAGIELETTPAPYSFRANVLTSGLHQCELQLQSQHQQLQIGQAAEEKVEANESESESAVVVTSSISSSISSSSSSSSPYMLAELTAPLLKWM